MRTTLSLADLRHRVQALPALSRAVMDALVMLRRDDASDDECATCIARDQAITARTLRLANSAFYGVPGRVSTIRDAMCMLGRRTLRDLIATAAVSDQFGHTHCAGFDFNAFWRHSIGAAMAAQLLADELGRHGEMAFIGGLVHDIGHLALAAYFPNETGVTLTLAQAQDRPLPEVEREVLGIDHAQVGAMIAEHWRFPAAVVVAIQCHHTITATEVLSPPDSLAHLVHLANALSHALDAGGTALEQVSAIEPATWATLALSPAQVLRIFKHTEAGVIALSEALAVQLRN